MSRQKASGGLVYSSDQGRMCPDCGKPAAACACRKGGRSPSGAGPGGGPDDGVVRIMRQTKGRGGKGVCLITGLAQRGEDLEKLARQLKQKCGTGGTVKDGVVEIQGDHRETLQKELARLGIKAKLAGG